MNWALTLDVVVFVAFIAAVISLGIFKSRHEKDSESYFLAGRGLMWWLIGFSLIAANISTEQFVGMSGQAASDNVGLAIASYEWVAAITLVVVAFFFLPKFLRSGIFTIPEFLEYRYNHWARTIMSALMVLTYVGVTISAVIYSGAKTVDVLATKAPAAEADDATEAPAKDKAAEDQRVEETVILGVPLNVTTASWIIGLLAAVYVAAGGLKACAWADLLQGSALIVGGAVVVILAMGALGQAAPEAVGLAPEMADAGSIDKFWNLNHDKMHMSLDATNTILPWTALILGIWIPNFYYWGLNQYIMQRTLGSSSLREGQKGIVFAAALKLLIPFIIVIPGIIAFNLYKTEMQEDAWAKTNRKTLDTFAEAQSDPAATGKAFAFNGDFAKLYPQQAQGIIEVNCQAAGIEVPKLEISQDGDKNEAKKAAEAMVEANGEVLKAISEKNTSRPVKEQIEVQTGLIGYQYDSAFGLLIKKLIWPGLRGFMLAAILGAVMSSLASMLNAASTIFTMDIYKRYLRTDASQGNLVTVGRLCVLVFVVIGCLIAPMLGNPRFGGIFTYIQEFQGFLSPGVLAIFVFGLFVHRAPRACGVVGLLLSPAIYGILMFVPQNLTDWMPLVLGSFLNRMAVTFLCLLVVLAVMTVVNPLKEPVTLPAQSKINMDSSRGALIFGLVVVIATIALYVIFW